MPDKQSSNAPDTPAMRDDFTAATVLSDDSSPERAPGPTSLPETTPNSAIDGGKAAIERDARAATAGNVPEPHPTSL